MKEVHEVVAANRSEIYSLAVQGFRKHLRKGEKWAVERVFDSTRHAQYSPAQTLESIKHDNSLAVLDKKQNQTKELLDEYPLQQVSFVGSHPPLELPDALEDLKH